MRTEWGDPPAYRDEFGGGGGGLSFPRVTNVTRKLLWINGIAWLVFFVLWSVSPEVGLAVRNALGLAPTYWWLWFPLVPVWQLVTYGFLHSHGDVFHVLFNLLALYFFGTMVEGVVGGRRFLFTYLAAAVVGGAAQLAMGLVQIGLAVSAAGDGPLNPAGLPPPTLGASGAVYAVLVAAAVMQPDLRVIFILFPLRLRTLALILVGINVFYMLSQTTNIAWLVHLVGAAYGFLAVRRRWIWADPLEGLGRWRSRRQAERAAHDERRLDELLARIQREGMGSLSGSERSFLKRVAGRRR